jgi:hypothetical protein
MAYLGNSPARSFISFERQVFTIVNSQTAYTLDHSVTNENDLRLVINNIVQEPGSGKAYTASGTTLTLSAALTNGTDEMYCVFLGRATATNAPAAGSVGATQLANNIISGQTALGATPADTDEFLVSDAGTLKRVDYSYIKGLENWSESSGNLLPSNASYGIYLGVNSATASNLLDDYEEGTFTPEITDGIGSRTHSVQEGVYTKIGRICKFKLRVKLSSGSANSNRISISGLPFTVFTDPPADGAYWSYLDSSVINSTSTNPPTLYQSRNTSYISFYKTSGADFTGNDLNSATPDFYIVGTYQTN